MAKCKPTRVRIATRKRSVDLLERLLLDEKIPVIDAIKDDTWMYYDKERAEEELYLYNAIVLFPSITRARHFVKEHCSGFVRSKTFRKFNEMEWGTRLYTYFKKEESQQ